MQNAIEQCARKALAYDEGVDGIGELTMGVFCYVFIAWMWMVHLRPDSMAHFWLSYGVTILPAWALTSFGKKWFRRRYTYARTGEVAVRHPMRRQLLAVTVAVVGSIAWVLVRPAESRMAVLAGIGGAVGALIGYYRTRVTRLVYLAGVMAAIGFGIGLLGVPMPKAFDWYLALTGVAFLISGGVTMAGYLRRTAA